jgi:hypothetical protein
MKFKRRHFADVAEIQQAVTDELKKDQKEEFSATFRTLYPASSTMGTGSFPGVKRPGHGADHPPVLASRLRKVRGIPLLSL